MYIKSHFYEHLFFFVLFGIVAYIVWQIIFPFLGALALAAIIATVFYPYYNWILGISPYRNKLIAAFFAVFFIVITLFLPLLILSYALFLQVLAFYDTLNKKSIAIGYRDSIGVAEKAISSLLPEFKINLTEYVHQGAGLLATNMGTVFASTISIVLLFFIMLISLFYMLKDGPEFVEKLIQLCPLPKTQSNLIIKKLTKSIRSVVIGTLGIALIQGILTSIGLVIFGVPQPILWGSIAAVCALIPYFGTSFVFIGAVLDALIAQSYGAALGLTIWGIFIVGLVDNILLPYLISSDEKSHPFAILISVLGGIIFFGPMGFLVGPVFLTLFVVLLELYSLHIFMENKEDVDPTKQILPVADIQI